MNNHPDSYARAVFEGRIQGPDWPVVDVETGEPLEAGDQDYGHVDLGRTVRLGPGRSIIGNVVDYQHPADTPTESRDDEVAYNMYEAQKMKLGY
jgi:hypothetical protein